MKRGIISNIGEIIKIDGGIAVGSNFSQNDLNYQTLYWDKVVIPDNNFFGFGIPNQEKLIQYGVLERPLVQFSSWSNNNSDIAYNPFIIAQSFVANDFLSSESNYDWTIHQVGEQIAIGKDQGKEFKSIKVELLNCLPVPTENTNIEDILKFKEKRNDELIALHSSIDDLYLEILKSPDVDLTSKKEISLFKKRLIDINKVSTEKFKRTSKYNFTTELNINGKDLGIAIGGGAAFDFFTSGLTLPIGTILSAVASVIKVKASKTISVENAESKLKLNYLSKAHKKGII